MDLVRLAGSGELAVVKKPIMDPLKGGGNITKAFRHELAVQSVLGHHPNVVRMLGACAGDDEAGSSDMFVALEHVTGGGLDQYLSCYGPEKRRRRRELGDKEKLSVLRDIASGLSNVHAARLTHRDIAARNCLVTECCQGMMVHILSVGGIKWLVRGIPQS